MELKLGVPDAYCCLYDAIYVILCKYLRHRLTSYRCLHALYFMTLYDRYLMMLGSM